MYSASKILLYLKFEFLGHGMPYVIESLPLMCIDMI